MTRDPASLTAAASRSESALSARADAADDEYEDDGAEGSDDPDWGLQRPKPRVAKQTIFGLAVIVVLLGMFSVLIFRKLQERKAAQAEQVADTTSDATPNDKPDTKPEQPSKPHGKGEGNVRPVNAVVASNTKGKVERAVESADPFDSLPDLNSTEPAAHNTAGAGRAAPRTTHAPPAGQREPFDMGLPEPDSSRSGHQPANRRSLPDSTELADVTPAHRAGGSAGRSASGHAGVGSGRTPKVESLDNDAIEVVELPGVDSPPAKKGAKVGGYTNSTSHSNPKSQLTQDELPVSAGNASDPFANNDEPPVTVKREPKPLKTTPTRHDPKSEELDAFDPAPAAKPSASRRSPPESRDSETVDSTPEKLGGFEVAKDPPLKKVPVESVEAEPTLEAEGASSANDPRLGGFQPVDNSRTRAISRTLVTRAQQPLRSSSESVTAVTGNRPTALTAAVEPSLESEPVSQNSNPVPTPTPVPTAIGVSPRRQPTPAAAPHTAVVPHPATDFGGRNPSGETYVIAPNDNYWTISRKQYGTARYFQALSQHNKGRIADPSRMRPGMVISTPAREVLEQQYPQLIDKAPAAVPAGAQKTSSIPIARAPVVAFGPNPTPIFTESAPTGTSTGVTPAGFFVGQDGQPMYRVGQSDTLTDIAQRHLGRASRWDEIYNRNKETIPNPDALKIGTVIRLPTDASRLGFVSEGGERR